MHYQKPPSLPPNPAEQQCVLAGLCDEIAAAAHYMGAPVVACIARQVARSALGTDRQLADLHLLNLGLRESVGQGILVAGLALHDVLLAKQP